MFDIGWPEFALIGVVALVAIGPKELPGALRTAGKWVGKARRMAQEFQNQFQEALREADVAEMKKQFDAAANAAQMTSDNLLGSVKNEVEALKIEEAGTAKPEVGDETPRPLLESAPAPPRETEAGAPSTTGDATPAEAAPVIGGKLS